MRSKGGGSALKLTVLVDNNTTIDRYYLGEPAVSYYMEDEGVRLLLDVGYSDIYVKNAASLGIDLARLDTLILSHAHNDHTGGLVHFPKRDGSVQLVCHPELFSPRRDEGESIGCPLSKEEAGAQFSLGLSRGPVKVSPHITYLGEIPRVTDFECLEPVGQRLTDAGWVPDFLPDDSALVYEQPDGIFILTGCSHSGICNIIRYAKAITGKQRVKGMLGGCHLFDSSSPQARRTAEFLAGEHIPALYPCHCTSFAARAALHALTPVREVGVGLSLEW